MQAAQVFSKALDDILDPKSSAQISSTPALTANGATGSLIPSSSVSGSTPVATGSAISGLDLAAADGLDIFDLDSWMQSVDWTSIGGEHTF